MPQRDAVDRLERAVDEREDGKVCAEHLEEQGVRGLGAEVECEAQVEERREQVAARAGGAQSTGRSPDRDDSPETHARTLPGPEMGTTLQTPGQRKNPESFSRPVCSQWPGKGRCEN